MKPDNLDLSDIDLTPNEAATCEVIEHLDEIDISEDRNLGELNKLARALELPRYRNELMRQLDRALAIAEEVADPAIISNIKSALACLRE